MFKFLTPNKSKNQLIWSGVLFGNTGLDRGNFIPCAFFQGEMLYRMFRHPAAPPRTFEGISRPGPYKITVHATTYWEQICVSQKIITPSEKFTRTSEIINDPRDEWIYFNELKALADIDFNEKYKNYESGTSMENV